VKKLVILSSVLLVGIVACSDDSNAGRRSDPNDDSGTGVKDGVIAPSGGSVRSPYQVKTSAEIASGVSACFGPGVTTVTATMIQSADNPGGFLAARQFSAGADVVAGEANIIDGDPSVGRTGVRNATLSLPILASLQDIGNVVGENCAAAKDSNPLCDCSTKDAAHAMLERCLPSIAPSQYAPLEDTFSQTCATNPAGAIASLLASTAFGVR
jgi:hypothetical protein